VGVGKRRDLLDNRSRCSTTATAMRHTTASTATSDEMYGDLALLEGPCLPPGVGVPPGVGRAVSLRATSFVPPFEPHLKQVPSSIKGGWGGWWGGWGGGVITKAPMHLVRAVYAWPLLSPRAKRSRRGAPAALPQPGLRGRGDAATGHVVRGRVAHSLRPKGIRLCSIFSALHRASGACRWRSVCAYSVLGST
jgi:hypothetical protein